MKSQPGAGGVSFSVLRFTAFEVPSTRLFASVNVDSKKGHVQAPACRATRLGSLLPVGEELCSELLSALHSLHHAKDEEI